MIAAILPTTTICDWMTQQVAPEIAANGGGLGFSFIAEAYLNFGWTGGILVMFVIGSVLGSLFLWGSQTDDHLRIAVTATFLAFLGYFARGEMTYVVRPLVWYAAMPAMMALLLAGIGSAQTRRYRPVSLSAGL